jgi:hypothetical protein
MEKENRFSRIFYAVFIFIYVMIIGLFWYFGTYARTVLSTSDKLIATVIFSALIALMGYVMLAQRKKV